MMMIIIAWATYLVRLGGNVFLVLELDVLDLVEHHHAEVVTHVQVLINAIAFPHCCSKKEAMRRKERRSGRKEKEKEDAVRRSMLLSCQVLLTSTTEQSVPRSR